MAPRVPERSERKTLSPLRVVLTIIAGGAVAIGLLSLTAILWFFAACANKPDCFQIG